MSRIGKRPISVPDGVKLAVDGQRVSVEGPKGVLEHTVPEPIRVAQDENGSVVVTRPDDERQNRSLHGLTRTLVSNLVVGVTDGYEKRMEINGVGYRVQSKGDDLEFSLGYSHPVTVSAPQGVSFTVESATKFSVKGTDKQQVGQTAAVIRKLKRPDPYKGKGVYYEGERIRRKVGKTGK